MTKRPPSSTTATAGPNTQHRKKSGAKPPKKVAAERPKFNFSVPEGVHQHWKAAIEPAFRGLAKERYPDSRGESGIFRLALDELWRRRNHPSPEILDKFAQCGLSDIIFDFDMLSVASDIVSAEKLYLVLPDFAHFTAMHSHGGGLAMRIMEGRTTYICVPARLDDDGTTATWHLDEKVRLGLVNLFDGYDLSALERQLHLERQHLDDPGYIPSFRVVGMAPDRREALPKIIWTEKRAIVANAFMDRRLRVAQIYAPAIPADPVYPRIEENRGIQTIYGIFEQESFNFHTKYRQACERIFRHGPNPGRLTIAVIRAVLDRRSTSRGGPLITVSESAESGS